LKKCVVNKSKSKCYSSQQQQVTTTRTHFKRASGSTYIQGGPKKTAPNFSSNNFGKYGPILIMFSLLHSQMN